MNPLSPPTGQQSVPPENKSSDSKGGAPTSATAPPPRLGSALRRSYESAVQASGDHLDSPRYVPPELVNLSTSYLDDKDLVAGIIGGFPPKWHRFLADLLKTQGPWAILRKIFSPQILEALTRGPGPIDACAWNGRGSLFVWRNAQWQTVTREQALRKKLEPCRGPEEQALARLLTFVSDWRDEPVRRVDLRGALSRPAAPISEEETRAALHALEALKFARQRDVASDISWILNVARSILTGKYPPAIWQTQIDAPLCRRNPPELRDVEGRVIARMLIEFGKTSLEHAVFIATVVNALHSKGCFQTVEQLRTWAREDEAAQIGDALGRLRAHVSERVPMPPLLRTSASDRFNASLRKFLESNSDADPLKLVEEARQLWSKFRDSPMVDPNLRGACAILERIANIGLPLNIETEAVPTGHDAKSLAVPDGEGDDEADAQGSGSGPGSSSSSSRTARSSPPIPVDLAAEDFQVDPAEGRAADPGVVRVHLSPDSRFLVHGSTARIVSTLDGGRICRIAFEGAVPDSMPPGFMEDGSIGGGGGAGVFRVAMDDLMKYLMPGR